MSHFVYMVRCVDDTLYTGYATDVKKRLTEHNGEGPASSPGARYTRPRRPVRLVYTEDCETRSAAMSREYAIKQLSRPDKLKLIAGWTEKKVVKENGAPPARSGE